MAARWAARLGYTRVYRYVEGYHHWLASQGKDAPAQPDGVAEGERFPGMRFTILGGDADRDYFVLPKHATHVTLDDIATPYALLLFFMWLSP